MSSPRTLTPSELAALSSDLRQACMRVSRRVRFESSGGLAPHLASVLIQLSKQDATPGELATLERVSAPSMTRTVNCLVDKGLVTRTPDERDRRQVVCSLTEAGRRTIADARRRRDEWMAVRVGALSAQDQSVLAAAAEILGRVAAS